jgi:hypothetical protein
VESGYIEKEYGFDTRPGGDKTFIGYAATVDNSNTITITSGSTTVNLANNDLVEIYNDDQPSKPMIAKVTSVTDDGSIVNSFTIEDLITNDILVGGGIVINKLADIYNQQGFTNSENNNIVRYIYEGTKYDTFKSFAIKFVLLADNAENAPRIADYRAIAMSA